MKWLKFRYKWASGIDRWEYHPLYVDKVDDALTEQLKEDMLEREHDYNWSDKFRGIEWTVIDHRSVPSETIVNRIRELDHSIVRILESIAGTKTHIEMLTEIAHQGRKTDPDRIEAERRKKRYERMLRANAKKTKAAK